jgi:hypothetical protein
MAHEMLTAKLKNQSEFTQMAYFGGENPDRSTKEVGIDGREAFVSPESL